MANHRSGLLWGSVGTSSHGRSFDHIWLLVDDGLCVCVCVGGRPARVAPVACLFSLSLFLSFKIFISVCLGMGKKPVHTLYWPTLCPALNLHGVIRFNANGATPFVIINSDRFFFSWPVTRGKRHHRACIKEYC